MSTPPNCPISLKLQDHQASISNLSKQMIRSLRALRNELYYCDECEHQPDCEIRTTLARQVHQAIEEVTEELYRSMNIERP